MRDWTKHAAREEFLRLQSDEYNTFDERRKLNMLFEYFEDRLNNLAQVVVLQNEIITLHEAEK